MKRLLPVVFGLLCMVSLVLAVRSLCVGSYQILTNAMAPVLIKGDFVLVNKMRWGSANPARGRTVLFSSPLKQDASASPLFVSRCVGMPGDTIRLAHHGYYINEQLFPVSLALVNVYSMPKDLKPQVLRVMNDLRIPYRKVADDSERFQLGLTPAEEIQLRANAARIVPVQPDLNHTWSYTFQVPQKGHCYALDSASVAIYGEAIAWECGAEPVVRNGRLWLDGKETSSYTFRENYYWMVSDQLTEGVDSRHLGLIPHRLVVGNVWFCWYSRQKEHVFRWIN